ncbi:MAG TPA: metallophosphoesterase [Caldilineae bacterium]|nr:metallophosphoesterase [Caldilineae bacterium]
MDNSEKRTKSISRRQFLKLGGVAAAAGVAGVAATSSWIVWHDESQDLMVERVTIPLPKLPPALEGFTIAQLSDIHLLPLTQPELVRRAVALTNSLNPDLTVLTGDYVWHEVESMFELAPIIADLNAKHGVLSIFGNHDLWTDADVVRLGLQEARVPLLVNEGVTLDVGGAPLHLAGLDDGWSGNPDLDAAMDNAPANATTILLMHEPDLADEYALDPRIALQLSGHSHGGQIRLPIIGPPVLPYLSWKYDMGLYRVGDMWLYTNRGIGVTNEPYRYNCRPEITEITLVKA